MCIFQTGSVLPWKSYLSRWVPNRSQSYKCSDCDEEHETTNSWRSQKTHGSTWCVPSSYQKLAQTAKPIYDLVSHDLRKKKNITSTKQIPRGNSGQVPSSSPVEWETRHQSALEVLIDHITSPSLLAYPYYDSSFTVHTDASQDGLGAVFFTKNRMALLE